MATRLETQEKRRAMRKAILESCRTGKVRHGDLLPPVRELARQYGLSVNLASEVIQSLVAEGVLNSRHGAGTFAGSSRPANMGAFLFLLPSGMSPGFVDSSYIGLVQRGFELRIAQLGGSCLTLDESQAREYAAQGELPALAGIFSVEADLARSVGSDFATHCAWFGELPAQDASASGTKNSTGDAVHFDDIDAGRQAAQHLLTLGHSNVAFLAMHAGPTPGIFRWSAEREEGWRMAMEQAQPVLKPLAFYPANNPVSNEGNAHGVEQMEAARVASAALAPLVRSGEVTAVVAANFFAARGLFEILQDAGITADNWPAVVCFDSFEGLDNHVVSALNMPWDEIGKAGAQLLWERNTGMLHGAGQLRQVPMQLIPRLTCRPQWKSSAGLIAPKGRAFTKSGKTREAVPA